MSMISAINNHVIVKIIKPDNMSEGGIVMPETRQLPQSYGEVLSVGEQVETVSEKDVVIFHQSGGQVILEGNIEYKVLKVDEIYGIRKGE